MALDIGLLAMPLWFARLVQQDHGQEVLVVQVCKYNFVSIHNISEFSTWYTALRQSCDKIAHSENT